MTKVGDKFMCIKNFYSLKSMKVVFSKGETYTCNKDGILSSGGYALHMNKEFLKHFTKINRTR